MNISRGKIQRAMKTVIYGPEGIGKTTFASQFPDALFIDTEGGTAYMEVARFDKPANWKGLLEEVRYVVQSPTCCRTLVIDTADWAEKSMIEWLCTSNGWNSIESPGYGKGYQYCAEEFARLLMELDKVVAAGVNVTVTAHAAMRKFEQPDEMGSYDRWEMKLSKKTAPLLKEWCDLLLFANYKTFVVKSDNKTEKAKVQGGKRVMYASHHPCWDAKNRQGLPDEMDFSFSEVAHLFGQKPAEPEPAKKTARRAAKKAAPKTETLPKEQPELEEAESARTPDPVFERMESAAPENVTDPHVAAVYDLMAKDGVTEQELQAVVAANGRYDSSVPIKDYDKKFLIGWCIKYWPRIVEKVEKARNQEGEN